MSLAPVQPSGWPSATAPPFTFTFAGSSPGASMTASAWQAKASFSSMRSMSSSVQAGLLQRLGDRLHRADAHDLRRHAGDREGDEARAAA